MRIMIEAARGRGDADLGQEITRALVRRRGCQVEMRHDRFDQLAADRIQRVERSQRILEYRADFASTDPAHGFGREFVYAPTVEPDFTGADSSRWVDEPYDCRTGKRFAGARFPDHPQHFAAGEMEVDAVQGGDGAEILADAAGIQERRLLGRRSRGFHPIPPSARTCG